MTHTPAVNAPLNRPVELQFIGFCRVVFGDLRCAVFQLLNISEISQNVSAATSVCSAHTADIVKVHLLSFCLCEVLYLVTHRSDVTPIWVRAKSRFSGMPLIDPVDFKDSVMQTQSMSGF